MTAYDTLLRPTVEQVVEALDSARQLVEHQGWCQNVAHKVVDGVDCYCALGALSSVCKTVRLSDLHVVPGEWIRDAAHAALTASLPPRYQTVARFNDNTTRGEVIELFWRAKATAQKAAA